MPGLSCLVAPPRIGDRVSRSFRGYRLVSDRPLALIALFPGAWDGASTVPRGVDPFAARCARRPFGRVLPPQPRVTKREILGSLFSPLLSTLDDPRFIHQTHRRFGELPNLPACPPVDIACASFCYY